MNTIHLDPKMVPAHLKQSYSGRKFKAIVTTHVTVPAHAGLWEGGSRDIYSLIRLADGHAAAMSDNMSSPWNDKRKDHEITLLPGFAVVRSSMFCGTDMGLTFYVHPDNAAQLLPAPGAELSDHEQIVLNATCQYKSSYGGRDRYQIARCDTRIVDLAIFPTREQWDEAKTSLIAKGLLNKAGAVTIAGKNARK